MPQTPLREVRADGYASADDDQRLHRDREHAVGHAAELSAPRQTGETRKRSITPRSMSSMNAMPFQPADEIAVMTITPGVRNSM